MKISAIEARMIRARDEALTALEVPSELFDQLHFAAPPEPHMGDRGFPCFVLARQMRKSPDAIATAVAEQIQKSLTEDDLISEVSTAGPYVNLRLHPGRLAQIVVGEALQSGDRFGSDCVTAPEHVMIEYSAPNTNKPQHLGHVRNNLIGAAVAKVLAFAGDKVTRVNLINDRGIHICKSMLAYELFGEGVTPESTGIKGDHLVGEYYVLFEKRFQEEYKGWQRTPAAETLFEAWLVTPAGITAQKEVGSDADVLHKKFFADNKDKYFNNASELGAQARKMLLDWEAGDEAVVGLWQIMNAWVFAGFDETYKRLGVGFDHVYYESKTYQLGKQIVVDALDDGIFERLENGAIACDLERVGLTGNKVLLRGDGTSVYMTQDLGTALQRFDKYNMDRMIYVVGDEQDYHFDVLFRVLGLLKPELAGRFYHLSYGMVNLPDGRMKSREGTVVDADELMNEMVTLAKEAIQERYAELPAEEIARRAEVIGLAALKYYILDFNPRSTVQFDPQKSIDFQGRTGPYCLYSYARIQSIARRFGGWPTLDDAQTSAALLALGSDLELQLIRQLQAWPHFVTLASKNMDPSKITEPLFNVCKAFSTMYNDADHRIVDLEGPRRDGLLLLARAVTHTLEAGLTMLGIDILDEM